MSESASKALKFLFVSRWGDTLDLANEIAKEGNKLKMHIEYKPCREVGDGFVKKVKDWKKHIDWADIILFDYT
jgi:phosphoribosylamine--glycine ligase